MRLTNEKDREEMKHSTIRDIFIFMTAILGFYAIETDSVLLWLFAMLTIVLAVAIDHKTNKQ